MINKITKCRDINIAPATNINFKQWIFPAGEVGFKLTDRHIAFEDNVTVLITTRLNTSDDIMTLMMAVDAIRQINHKTDISLRVPYLPYGRQDRVCSEGESFSIKVFANIINSLNFKEVFTFEPHSPITGALINRLKVQLEEINRVIYQSWEHILTSNSVLVSPDIGAVKRIGNLQTYFRALPNKHELTSIVANKVRDCSNGEIVGMDLNGDVRGKDCFVFDDIAEGGRTFIELAKILDDKGAKSKHLFVVHGIFSKGVDVVCDMFDSVSTTDTYQDFNNQETTMKHPSNFKVFSLT